MIAALAKRIMPAVRLIMLFRMPSYRLCNSQPVFGVLIAVAAYGEAMARCARLSFPLPRYSQETGSGETADSTCN